MPISVGAKAPNFTLKQKTADGLKDVTLSDHAGNEPVVLVFFPSVYTGVCTDEMCDKGGGLAAAMGLGAAVYGISTDSPFAQEAWAKANGITIPLLSDYDHSVVRTYDVEWPSFVGIGPSAARAAVVIGRDGTVKYSEQTPTLGELPDFEKIKAALAGA
ncbi:MAG TPA: redoxin domain-containing protein [Fimbriimonadaceae bacterium]|nr:redoxin domain-containing protein [Fimbriimonadaceae bacterium]